MDYQYIKVITNPEFGWNCVVKVYTDHVSDEDIKEKWPEDEYVISRMRVSNCVEPFDG